MSAGTATPVPTAGWSARLLAGTLAGGMVSLGTMALVGRLAGCIPSPQTVGAQALMWLVAPIWCAVMATSVLFRSAARAWSVLGGAAVLVWLGWFALREMLR
jgi:hypothetical protein